MEFYVYPYRLVFRAQGEVYFPPGKAENVFRGKLGLKLKELVCDPFGCPGANVCERRADCAYVRMFEPKSGVVLPAAGEALSASTRKLFRPGQKLPRPYVFRAASLDGQTFGPGQAFSCELSLFDASLRDLRALELMFARAAREGIGAGRGRANLARIEEGETMKLDLTPRQHETRHLRVVFETPTELKCKKKISETPTELKRKRKIIDKPLFVALFERAADRLQHLMEYYQGACGDLAPEPLRSMAENIKLEPGHDWKRVIGERKSGKTDQTHPLGGYVGYADYVGDLGPFMSILEAARFAGIGRHAPWGHGVIHLEQQR